MKKVLFIIVAMVLLSGAAWGAEPDFAWYFEPGSPQSAGCPSGMGMYFYAYGTPEKHSSKWICEEKHSSKWICEEKPKFMTYPWGDSRYRLEKNEVTGRYRITKMVQRPKEGTPQGIINEWVVFITDDMLMKTSDNEREIFDNALNELRKKEREDRAWKPIK